jgi:hypothetical protein
MSAPASASAKAIAWPIPLVPPVTIAVFPLSEKSWLTVADIVTDVMFNRIIKKNSR